MGTQNFTKNPKLSRVANFGAFLNEWEGYLARLKETGGRITAANMAKALDMVYDIPDVVTEENAESLSVQRKHNAWAEDTCILLARSFPGANVGPGGIGFEDSSPKVNKEEVDLAPLIKVLEERLPRTVVVRLDFMGALSAAYGKHAQKVSAQVKKAFEDNQVEGFVTAKVGRTMVIHRKVLDAA